MTVETAPREFTVTDPKAVLLMSLRGSRLTPCDHYAWLLDEKQTFYMALTLPYFWDLHEEFQADNLIELGGANHWCHVCSDQQGVKVYHAGYELSDQGYAWLRGYDQALLRQVREAVEAN